MSVDGLANLIAVGVKRKSPSPSPISPSGSPRQGARNEKRWKGAHLIALCVTYTTEKGKKIKLQITRDIFSDLDSAVRRMFRDTGINVDDYQFFNSFDEEETLTMADGSRVLLDYIPCEEDDNLISLSMIRKSSAVLTTEECDNLMNRFKEAHHS